MADTLQGAITDLSTSVIATNTATVVNNQTGSTVIQSQLDTAPPEPTSTKITVTPSTDNVVPVLYGTSYVPGIIVDARISNDSQSMYYIYALSEITDTGTVAVDAVYMGDQLLAFTPGQSDVINATSADGTLDTNPAGYIDVWVYRERTTPIFGALSGTADSIVPGFTTTNQFGGLYFAIVRVKYNAALGYVSMPQMTFKLTNSLSNPGAVWYDYMTNSRYGAGIPIARVDTNSSINEANSDSLFVISEELTTYRDSAGADQSGVRYGVNGLVAGGTVRDTIRKINLASGSWTTWNPKLGLWVIVPNRPVSLNTELFNFDDSNIISGINVGTTSLNSNYNAMAVTYPETAIKSQNHTVRESLVDSNPELLNLNEPENTLNLSLDLVNNRVQATRIGLLELKQAREDIVTIFNANYTALQVDAGDVISVTNSSLGWDLKLFRVTRVREIETDDAEIQVEISALEYNVDVYTDESIDQFEPVANTDIPRRNSSGQLQALDVPTIPDDLYNPVATVPSFSVRAVVPTRRVYDNIEFFISNTTAGGVYTYYNTLRPESGIFQPDSSHDLQVTGLPEGQYFFKARAKIGSLTTPLSSASSGVNWTPGVILNEQALATAFEWSPATVVVPTDSEGLNPVTGQVVDLVLRVGTTMLNLSAATTDETQEINTWRVTNITYDSAELGLSAPIYDTQNDRIRWTISDLNQLQQSLAVTVRYKNSSGLVNDIGTTKVLATQLRAGADGSDSRSLKLIASGNTFIRLKGETDANAVSYLPQQIQFTAELNNITGSSVSFSAVDQFNNSVALNVIGNTATLLNSSFGDKDYVIINAEIDSNGITYFDQQTINRLREGADGVMGITAILSNEVAALPAASDGTYQSADLAAINSQIQIFSGSSAITETYTLTIDSAIGCTASLNITSGANYGRISINTVTADLANITIRAAKTGSATIFKTFVIVKQRRGAAGSTAQLLRVSSTSPLISIARNGSLSNTATHQPAAITYYADTINFSGTTINWTGQIEGQPSVALGTGTTLTLSATQIRNLLTTSESVRTAIITATTTLGTVIFSDTTSINRVREGSDTITAYLTDEVTAVPCSAAGTPLNSNLATITSDIKVMQGSTVITSGITYSIFSSAGVTGAVVEAETSSTPGRISISTLTADRATVVVRATYIGINIDRTFTIVKQRQGLEGVARRVEILSPIGFVLPKNTVDANTNYTPTNLTLVVNRTNIASTTPVRWYIVLNNVEIEQTGVASADLNNFQALTFTSGSVSSRNAPVLSRQYWQEELKFRVRLLGDDGIDYFDDFTPILLREGSDIAALVLSNQAISFAATSLGVFSSTQFPATINASVMIGSSLATGWTFNFALGSVYEYARPMFTATNNQLTINSITVIPGTISETVFRRAITVTASKTGSDSITSIINISLLRSGADAASSIFLTNEVHNLSADYTGLVSNYTNAFTDIYVYEKGAPVNASQWTFTVSPAVDTTLGYTRTVYTGTDGRIGRVAIDSMTVSSRVLTITATKTGVSGSYVKQFSLNRVSAGAPGLNAANIRAIASSQQVRVSNTGVLSPTSIQLNASLTGALSGQIAAGWEFIAGTGTLTSGGTNNTKNLATNSLSDLVTTLRVWYNNVGDTADLRRYYDDISIVKVLDGATGATGSIGNRGSRIFNQSIIGTAFNITSAYTTAQVSGGPIPGDTVTQFNNGVAFTATKIWVGAIGGANDSANWSTVNNVIDGSLLVTGSVRASKIFADDTYTMNIQSNNYVAGTQGWRIANNGVAEFSNITARGSLEAASIYTGSVLKDKYVSGTTQYDYPIYTTASRQYSNTQVSLLDRPIPYRPSISNYGAPQTNFEIGKLERGNGPWVYDAGQVESFIAPDTSGIAMRADNFYTPVFATSAGWPAGGEDRIENRVRKFLSSTDQIAFGGTYTVTTNAPSLEVFYIVKPSSNYTWDTPLSSSSHYTRMRSAGVFYNPEQYRRLAVDTGLAANYGATSTNTGTPGPWRVTGMTTVGTHTKIDFDATNYADITSTFQVGDTVWMAGGEHANSTNQWAGTLTNSGAAWTPGTISSGVGSIANKWIGVRVTAVTDYNTIEVDVVFANSSIYASGALLFNSVGEQWVEQSDGATLYNTNRPWTFNFANTVKWTDFFEGTAPTFPAGGVSDWQLFIGLRAPRSAGWWVLNPSASFWAQNL